MHEVPPTITGTFMPTSYQSDQVETQATFGSKSNTSSITTFESNDCVSCDNSDKSSASETNDFASCVSSPKINDSFSTVDVKLLPKSDFNDPSPTNGLPSCSFKDNVKPLRNLCNKSGTTDRLPCKNNFARSKKCFVCGSKSHLIKDCHVYDTVDNVPSVVSKAASVPAGSRNSSASTSAGRSISVASRNRSASIHASRSISAASRNRSASIHAGRSIPAASRNISAFIHVGRSIPVGRIDKPAPFPAGSFVPTGWTNPAAKSFFGPTNLYFDNAYWPGIYDHMPMNEGRWGSAVKSSTEKLDDFVQVKGSTVTLRGGDGKITEKGTIRTSKLNFENVYYVEVLQNFNLFSVSQICDKKNKVLFIDDECLVLTKEFQLPDESQVVLRIPRRHDLYTFNLSDIQPEQHINCLLTKASLEESTKWHRRMTHVNFKTINKSIDHKYYSLVVTDDFSRLCWALFLGTKDETFYILKDFIALIENQLNKKIKAIRCDNGTKFQNAKLITLCGEKGIKRDYSNARTPQQNGVAKRKNKTLIEAARSMLADSKLPTMFWTEAVSTAWKANDGFLVRYAAHSKAYRVYNLSSKKGEETLNLRYLEDKPNVQGLGQEWYFDLHDLTDSLGYTHFKTNPPAGTHDTNIIAGIQAEDSESECDEQVILVPSFPSNSFLGPTVHDVSAPMENNLDYAEELARLQRQEYEAHSIAAKHGFEFSDDTAALLHQAAIETRRNLVLAAGDPARSIVSTGGVPAGSVPAGSLPTSSVPASGVSAGSIPASIVSTGDVPAGSVPTGGVPAGSLSTSSVSAGGVIAGSIDSAEFGVPAASKSVPAVFSNDPDATSPLPPEPSSVAKALEDPDWVTAMQEEMQQFYHQQEEGIDYDEVFAPVARIEAIRLFLAFASYMGFMVYQMEVKSAFLYGEIEEEVYVTQLKGFKDPHNSKHVYKVVKALYGLHQAPRAWYARLSTFLLKHHYRRAWCDEFEVLMKGEFKISSMGELMFFLGLQVKQLPDGIFISQDKYVKDMLKKFDMESMRTATIPYEVLKHKLKDDPDDVVNVHLFRFMIGSLMYLIATRPDIMFVVSACSRHQCKKQTVVATSSTEAEYVAASCCGQVSNAAGCTCIPTGSYSFMLWTWFLLLLFHVVDLVPAGSCITPTGSYSSMLWTWFLLVVVLFLLVVGLVPTGRYVVHAAYVWFLLILKISNTVWDGPHMPLLAPMLVVLAAGDGADAVAAGAAAAHDVLPPSAPPTHSSSSIPRPFSAPQSSPVREPTPVREPIPVREPTPRPV
nr:retrotransposon protein, putative, unclassified [Tanacetum cinerariifolium]